jgi:hypothetical protein
MTKHEPAVPEPSYLPPNPSVGELVTEIDRARHDAARTISALADKFDVKARVQRRAHDQFDALGWDSRRVAADLRALRDRLLDTAPEPVQKALVTTVRYAKQVPVPVRIGVVIVLLRWWRGRRHAR